MTTTTTFHLTLLATLLVASGLSLVDARGFPTAEEAAKSSVQYLSNLCIEQKRLLPPLLTALQANDLTASRIAYANSRPPYEQIEVLANIFPDLDRDIDARPNVFERGENNANFKGFHTIERYLYRENNPTAAIPDAEELTRSVDSLCAILEQGDPAAFTPEAIFDGALTLAIEVPAKKISSEEETWSDLSILIFRSNFRGIWGVVEPFLALEEAYKYAYYARKRYAQLIALFNKLDPENGFDGVNGGQGTRPYSDVSTAERDAISTHAYYFVHAIKELKKAVIMPSDSDSMEEEETAPVPIIDSSAYVNETAVGIENFLDLCKYQQSLLYDLHHAIEDNDLAKARHAYRISRPPYEQIEVLAADFPELDRAIDARPDVFELGELDPEWGGFHEIERDIFRDEDLKDALPVMDALNKSVDELCRVLETSDRFTADSTWRGMLTLTYEVAAKKISSEEETWSDLSVMIFRENAKGIYEQYLPFKKRLPKYIARDVEARFEDITTDWINIIDRDNLWHENKFRLYSAVPVYERRMISERFYALAASLEAARDALIQA